MAHPVGAPAGRRCELSWAAWSAIPPKTAQGGDFVPWRTLTRPPASRVGTRSAGIGTRSARLGTRSVGTRSARIVATAARWIYDGRRLDMQGLADELGV